MGWPQPTSMTLQCQLRPRAGWLVSLYDTRPTRCARHFELWSAHFERRCHRCDGEVDRCRLIGSTRPSEAYGRRHRPAPAPLLMNSIRQPSPSRLLPTCSVASSIGQQRHRFGGTGSVTGGCCCTQTLGSLGLLRSRCDRRQTGIAYPFGWSAKPPDQADAARVFGGSCQSPEAVVHAFLRPLVPGLGFSAFGRAVELVETLLLKWLFSVIVGASVRTVGFGFISRRSCRCSVCEAGRAKGIARACAEACAESSNAPTASR